MKKLMAANWKMYKTREEAKATAEELLKLAASSLPEDREVLVCPPFTSLGVVSEVFSGVPGFFVGGQDFYFREEGAFTGEIAPGMLLDQGAHFGLTGHSERRHVIGEGDELVGKKTAFGLASGLSVILCIGELIEERRAGRVEEVLERQLRLGLADVPNDIDPERLCVAYEPVWAIGTGEVAGPREILEAHAFVRKTMVAMFGDNANEIRILYGGSVKPSNCAEIIALDNVDGVLVGGASLQGESFSQIVLA
ncbi:triose-phosphate isomerase [Pseudodesulfovibrio sp. F-1]|uniref:Triosephosphate isomerase n=1 Tax=Pseudodesulfovibrio alkaliphilus TaxID=2661613 RepID=A0A7K1KQA1_9BACT|nr:triose-phosphate isomerase [Pseudodesulfovibrio alkaliphilus]MUM78269.1 triose-phosphate isomerase [Pseudodesulfovibrio alkaliphilus]